MKNSWWDRNLFDPKKEKDFKGWVGDHTATTKVITARYIKAKRYMSVLDIGCANMTFKQALEVEGYLGKYTGADSSTFWLGQEDFVQADIEELQFKDNEFDVSYVRHVLEHLYDFRKGLSEAIRVCSKECIVVFFNKPLNERKNRYIIEQDLYDNTYPKLELENFLKEKGLKFEFESLAKETILYIQK